ncbi:MAG: hypothetical protein WCT04_18585 [Planctomycetota bacterium]
MFQRLTHRVTGRFVVVAAILMVACAQSADTDWTKIETKFVPLQSVRQVLTPGCFDRTLWHVFPVGVKGAAADTGLPHGGMDKTGKPRPAIVAKFAKDVVFIDFTGDGKSTAENTKRITPEGWSDPFQCDLNFDDGSTAKYAFRIKTVIEGEKYAILRAGARTFEFGGKTVTLFDDDGNGLYNDAGRDSVLVNGQPVCVLGKHIRIGEDTFELIVHASGERVEIRPMPKDTVTGIIEPFEKYEPSQRSENLKLHTLIFYGPEGSFACDDTHRVIKAPAGLYDLVFGLFERNGELVYIKKGEKTSFTVTANIKTQLKWGGKIKAKFSLISDGEDVTLGVPHYFGQMSEEYFPDSTKQTVCSARISQVYRDRTNFDIEGFVPFGAKKFETLPDGSFKPIIFKRYRTVNDEYEGYVEYTSGIMGRVEGKERLAFVYRKKK